MMGNIKELLLGAAYVGCIIGVAYVTLFVIGNAIGVHAV
jgi:hypothetical protein